MKQCAGGHIYDETKYGECPYCSGGGANVRPLSGNSANFPNTAPLGDGKASAAFPKTMPLNAPTAGAASEAAPEPKRKKEMGVTVALDTAESGIKPVKGWLVVIEGEKKGIPFTVHGDRNTIGRGAEHDINLSFDKAASKSGDAMISFDPRKSRFYINVMEGKNNVYLNEEILLQPQELKDYDIVEVGGTKFVFRSLCNEQFTY